MRASQNGWYSIIDTPFETHPGSATQCGRIRATMLISVFIQKNCVKSRDIEAIQTRNRSTVTYLSTLTLLSLDIEVQTPLSIPSIPPRSTIPHLITLATSVQERGRAISRREQTKLRRAVLH